MIIWFFLFMVLMLSFGFKVWFIVFNVFDIKLLSIWCKCCFFFIINGRLLESWIWIFIGVKCVWWMCKIFCSVLGSEMVCKVLGWLNVKDLSWEVIVVMWLIKECISLVLVLSSWVLLCLRSNLLFESRVCKLVRGWLSLWVIVFDICFSVVILFVLISFCWVDFSVVVCFFICCCKLWLVFCSVIFVFLCLLILISVIK